FSSRRRHTRFSRDWSSDVCSSDLTQMIHHFWSRILARVVVIVLPGKSMWSKNLIRLRRMYSVAPVMCCWPKNSALPRLAPWRMRSEEHTSELQSRENLVCRLLLEK